MKYTYGALNIDDLTIYSEIYQKTRMQEKRQRYHFNVEQSNFQVDYRLI